MISFFNLYEMFQPIISANNIGSLFNNLLGLKIFNVFPSIFFLFYSSSSSSGCIVGK